MKTNDAIENLRLRIANIYKKSRDSISDNIYRGHSRVLNTDIEDSITLFLSDILPKTYCFFIDSSIYINGEKHRPDLLVINEKSEAVVMIEIKSNMGWCRNASNAMNKLKMDDLRFKNKGKLCCEFSNEQEKEITYGQHVKTILISLTNENCSEDKHKKNKEIAKSLGVEHFILFSGWYGHLENKDIEDFAARIFNLSEQND